MRNCTFGQVPCHVERPRLQRSGAQVPSASGGPYPWQSHLLQAECTLYMYSPSSSHPESHHHLIHTYHRIIIKTFQRFHVLTNWMPWGFGMVQILGNWVWGNWREEFEGASLL